MAKVFKGLSGLTNEMTSPVMPVSSHFLRDDTAVEMYEDMMNEELAQHNADRSFFQGFWKATLGMLFGSSHALNIFDLPGDILIRPALANMRNIAKSVSEGDYLSAVLQALTSKVTHLESAAMTTASRWVSPETRDRWIEEEGKSGRRLVYSGEVMARDLVENIIGLDWQAVDKKGQFALIMGMEILTDPLTYVGGLGAAAEVAKAGAKPARAFMSTVGKIRAQEFASVHHAISQTSNGRKFLQLLQNVDDPAVMLQQMNDFARLNKIPVEEISKGIKPATVMSTLSEIATSPDAPRFLKAKQNLHHAYGSASVRAAYHGADVVKKMNRNWDEAVEFASRFSDEALARVGMTPEEIMSLRGFVTMDGKIISQYTGEFDRFSKIIDGLNELGTSGKFEWNTIADNAISTISPEDLYRAVNRYGSSEAVRYNDLFAPNPTYYSFAITDMLASFQGGDEALKTLKMGHNISKVFGAGWYSNPLWWGRSVLSPILDLPIKPSNAFWTSYKHHLARSHKTLLGKVSGATVWDITKTMDDATLGHNPNGVSIAEWVKGHFLLMPNSPQMAYAADRGVEVQNQAWTHGANRGTDIMEQIRPANLNDSQRAVWNAKALEKAQMHERQWIAYQLYKEAGGMLPIVEGKEVKRTTFIKEMMAAEDPVKWLEDQYDEAFDEDIIRLYADDYNQVVAKIDGEQVNMNRAIGGFYDEVLRIEAIGAVGEKQIADVMNYVPVYVTDQFQEFFERAVREAKLDGIYSQVNRTTLSFGDVIYRKVVKRLYKGLPIEEVNRRLREGGAEALLEDGFLATTFEEFKDYLVNVKNLDGAEQINQLEVAFKKALEDLVEAKADLLMTDVNALMIKRAKRHEINAIVGSVAKALEQDGFLKQAAADVEEVWTSTAIEYALTGTKEAPEKLLNLLSADVLESLFKIKRSDIDLLKKRGVLPAVIRAAVTGNDPAFQYAMALANQKVFNSLSDAEQVSIIARVLETADIDATLSKTPSKAFTVTALQEITKAVVDTLPPERLREVLVNPKTGDLTEFGRDVTDIVMSDKTIRDAVITDLSAGMSEADLVDYIVNDPNRLRNFVDTMPNADRQAVMADAGAADAPSVREVFIDTYATNNRFSQLYSNDSRVRDRVAAAQPDKMPERITAAQASKLIKTSAAEVKQIMDAPLAEVVDEAGVSMEMANAMQRESWVLRKEIEEGLKPVTDEALVASREAKAASANARKASKQAKLAYDNAKKTGDELAINKAGGVLSAAREQVKKARKLEREATKKTLALSINSENFPRIWRQHKDEILDIMRKSKLSLNTIFTNRAPASTVIRMLYNKSERIKALMAPIVNRSVLPSALSASSIARYAPTELQTKILGDMIDAGEITENMIRKGIDVVATEKSIVKQKLLAQPSLAVANKDRAVAYYVGTAAQGTTATRADLLQRITKREGVGIRSQRLPVALKTIEKIDITRASDSQLKRIMKRLEKESTEEAAQDMATIQAEVQHRTRVAAASPVKAALTQAINKTGAPQRKRLFQLASKHAEATQGPWAGEAFVKSLSKDERNNLYGALTYNAEAPADILSRSTDLEAASDEMANMIGDTIRRNKTAPGVVNDIMSKAVGKPEKLTLNINLPQGEELIVTRETLVNMMDSAIKADAELANTISSLINKAVPGFLTVGRNGTPSPQQFMELARKAGFKDNLFHSAKTSVISELDRLSKKIRDAAAYDPSPFMRRMRMVTNFLSMTALFGVSTLKHNMFGNHVFMLAHGFKNPASWTKGWKLYVNYRFKGGNPNMLVSDSINMTVKEYGARLQGEHVLAGGWLGNMAEDYIGKTSAFGTATKEGSEVARRLKTALASGALAVQMLTDDPIRMIFHMDLLEQGVPWDEATRLTKEAFGDFNPRKFTKSENYAKNFSLFYRFRKFIVMQQARQLAVNPKWAAFEHKWFQSWEAVADPIERDIVDRTVAGRHGPSFVRRGMAFAQEGKGWDKEGRRIATEYAMYNPFSNWFPSDDIFNLLSPFGAAREIIDSIIYAADIDPTEQGIINSVMSSVNSAKEFLQTGNKEDAFKSLAHLFNTNRITRYVRPLIMKEEPLEGIRQAIYKTAPTWPQTVFGYTKQVDAMTLLNNTRTELLKQRPDDPTAQALASRFLRMHNSLSSTHRNYDWTMRPTDGW